jgi:hypothetical protein
LVGVHLVALNDMSGQAVEQHSGARSRIIVWLEHGLVCVLIATLGWLYWLTVTLGGGRVGWGNRQEDYYSLLVDGFLDGHGSLSRP